MQFARRALSIALAAFSLSCAAGDDAERRAFAVAGTFAPIGLRPADRALFTRATAWHVPVSELAALFGLVTGDYDWSDDGLVVRVWVDPKDNARVAAFSMAWAYVYRQQAVLVFESGRAAMRWHPQADAHSAARLLRDVESELHAMRARYERVVSMMSPRRPHGSFGGGDS